MTVACAYNQTDAFGDSGIGKQALRGFFNRIPFAVIRVGIGAIRQGRLSEVEGGIQFKNRADPCFACCNLIVVNAIALQSINAQTVFCLSSWSVTLRVAFSVSRMRTLGDASSVCHVTSIVS